MAAADRGQISATEDFISVFARTPFLARAKQRFAEPVPGPRELRSDIGRLGT